MDDKNNDILDEENGTIAKLDNNCITHPFEYKNKPKVPATEEAQKAFDSCIKDLFLHLLRLSERQKMKEENELINDIHVRQASQKLIMSDTPDYEKIDIEEEKNHLTRNRMLLEYISLLLFELATCIAGFSMAGFYTTNDKSNVLLMIISFFFMIVTIYSFFFIPKKMREEEKVFDEKLYKIKFQNIYKI